MSDHAATSHDHHAMPTGGRALTNVAVSATLHCLTGCAIGEVAGMAIGTALGFSDLGTIALAVALAFFFGYLLTSLPLLRAGLALSVVIPIALASDTISIATMEVVDNLIMVAVPGAMEAGLGDLLFWGALSFALAVAFVLTVPVNRWLIGRGKGHTAVHETGIHGGPSPRFVGAVVAVAAVFGSTVLIAEAASDEGGGHGHMTAGESSMPAGEDHTAHAAEADSGAARGLTTTAGGLKLELDRAEIVRGADGELRFTIAGEDGQAVTDFDIDHEKRMHLIVVRRDLTGFQHLHPSMSKSGAWTTPLTLDEPGGYRVFADFNHDGEDITLAGDLDVAGDAEYAELPLQKTEIDLGDGLEVGIEGEAAIAGQESELAFNIGFEGKPITPEPYLGAGGHLVAIRESDLAFLHVHPVEGEAAPGAGEPVRFLVEFPSPGPYRLFLQFKHRGEVHTAAFTRDALEPPPDS